MSDDFTGFVPDLFDFLADLEAHNERPWFKANQDRYESVLREPARAFIRAMADPLEDISPHLRTSDKKVGGSLMRIHRDVRFSADKSPYKLNVGIQFRHKDGKDVHAPGYYVHLSADDCFLGAGSWMPDRDALAAYRRAIDEHPKQWLAVRKIAEHPDWRIDRDTLKRPPRGWSADHPLIEDIKRKHFIAVTDFDPEDAIGPNFVEDIAERFRETQDWMAFLTRSIGLEF